MQAALALLGAVLTLVSCYSLGSAVAVRLAIPLGRWERFPVALLLGASLLQLAVFAVLALKIAYPTVLVILLVIGASAGLYRSAWRATSESNDTGTSPTWLKYALGAIAAVYFYVYWMNAWAPELSPDGSTYHLGLVARYLRTHGFEQIPTNFYSSLSAGFEMLFVPAFAIGRHSAAAMVHFGFLIALGVAVFAYGRRFGKPIAGACAALLICLAPIVGVDGTSAYVDAAAALAAFLTFYLTQIWEEQRTDGLLIAIGLVGGYCYAVKYTMAVMLVYAAIFVWWKGGFRAALRVSTTSAVLILPWMIKNWIYFQNPIAPFGNTIFRNPFIHPEFERYWSEYLRHYEMTNLWQLPLEVTIHGEKLGGALGPVFLAAPIALLALAKKQGRRLLLPAALLLAVYAGNVGTRFLIPVLPFVALAMMFVLERASVYIAPLVIVGHAIASWPGYVHQYSKAWTIQRVPYKAALRLQSEEDFLGAKQDYQTARLIQTTVPEGGRVFAANSVPDAYTSRETLVGFQGATNAVLEDILGVAAFDIYMPKRAWVSRFGSKTVRGIRITQTGTMSNPDELWNVHEVRLYSQGRELPRDAAWRLSAFPNPWDAGMAFDNSETTRWRTWEIARPGNFIEVTFGKDQLLDEVRVETSPDNEDVQLKLEFLDAQGNSTPADPNGGFRKFHFTYEGDLKREATRELHDRGVDFILMRDTDWGGPVFSQDPASWGLSVAGRVGTAGSGATLYRITKP